MPDDPPFPTEAVRDLLGIARALYLTLQRMGPAYVTQLHKVTAIGAQLGRAIEKARKGGPGTWNQKTAWIMADKAAADLLAMVDIYLPAKNLIAASGDRLRKK